MRQALIVEDDADTASLLAASLRPLQISSTILLEGSSAVAWATEHRPDLILLDLMLPDIEGSDICRTLKLDRATNLIPIVIVTAKTSAEDRVHGLEVGANYYLAKPFGAEDLHEAVEKVLTWRTDLEARGTEGEIRFKLQSAAKYLDELNQMLASLFYFTPLSDKQISHLALAVRELGINAIEWGNQKKLERLVTVTYRINSDNVTIIIRDSGPGFDPKNMPHAASADDPVAHLAVRENMGLRDGGCGILMVRGLVDELEYNETGNEVRLVKHFPPKR